MTTIARNVLRLAAAAAFVLSYTACDNGGGDADSGPDADTDSGADAGPDGGGQAFEIDPQRIYDDVAWLSDDAREGREAGTAGNQAALDYVAAAFAAMGVAPAGDGEGYYDAFTYPEWRETAAPSLVVDGEAAVAGTDYDVLRYSPSGGGEGEIVFVGFAMIVPPFDPADYPDCPYPPEGVDELAGLDLAGNTVLKFSGVPLGDASLLTDCPAQSSAAALEEAGVAALLAVHDYTWPFDEVSAGATLLWNGDYAMPMMYLSRSFAETLVPDLHDRYDAILEWQAASSATGHAVSVSVEAAVADNEIANVLGVVPGTSPELGDEVVYVGGHIDHVGRELGSDAIYNGADDNASGTAVMMEIARGVAAIPDGPARTIVFAAWNAEESGLFGSCAYAADPHYPMADTLAMLNLDAVGAGSGTGAYLISGGDDQSLWLSTLMGASAAAQGLEYGISATPHLESSDHTCFFSEGVAAMTMQTLGNHTYTHTQWDDLDAINPADLEAAARLTWAAIRPLAEGTEGDYE